MPKPRAVWWIEYQRGPAWPAGQQAPKQALQDHQIYLEDLMQDGKLLMAGLFRDDAGVALRCSTVAMRLPRDA